MKKKIVVLYSEVMPYTIGVLEALKNIDECSILLVYWDTKKLTPFAFSNDFVDLCIPRSQTNYNDLKRMIAEFDPDLIWASGRMDNMYLKICSFFKNNNVKTVMGCDNQWQGVFGDLLREKLSWFLYRRYFSYCWVPGVSQFVFCQKMGFQISNIKENIYSAHNIFFNSQIIPGENKRFLYVGRFNDIKNIKKLVFAFNKIKDRNGWKLRLIGSGEISSWLPIDQDIEVYSFEGQAELIEHAKSSSVFVLPSLKEPWGVVVHEFSALGMPLLLSDRVGAKHTFLIKGYNGFLFNPYSTEELQKHLIYYMNSSNSQLNIMGQRSFDLSRRITPEISAASLLSIID